MKSFVEWSVFFHVIFWTYSGRWLVQVTKYGKCRVKVSNRCCLVISSPNHLATPMPEDTYVRSRSRVIFVSQARYWTAQSSFFSPTRNQPCKFPPRPFFWWVWKLLHYIYSLQSSGPCLCCNNVFLSLRRWREHNACWPKATPQTRPKHVKVKEAMVKTHHFIRKDNKEERRRNLLQVSMCYKTCLTTSLTCICR